MTPLLQIITLAAACLATFLCAASPSAADGLEATTGNVTDSRKLEHLEEAQRRHPYDEGIRRRLRSAYLARGQELMEKRDYEGAAAQFERGQELYPDDAGFGTLTGIAFYLLGKPDLARYHLERSRGLPGGETPALFGFLGRIQYDAGDLRRALEVWEEGLAASPDDAVLLDLAARARRELTVEEGMATGNSSRFLITYDGSVRVEAAALVLEELETAMRVVGSDLEWYPENAIPVILYTRRDYRSVTESPDWSGGSYDGKIRLPVGGVQTVTPQLRAILRHEYTHAVVHALTRGNCPVWLNEGLAEYQGRRVHDVPLADLQLALKQRSVSLAPPDGSFAGLKGEEARLAYEISCSLVTHMVRSYGMHKVRDLLLELGQGKGVADAAASAFADLGLSFAEMLQEWRHALMQGS